MDPVKDEVRRLADWRLLAIAMALGALVQVGAFALVARRAAAVYYAPDAVERVVR